MKTNVVRKPKWWPENPYFESAMDSIKNDTDYAKAIPDPALRTAVSWYLSNRIWELASSYILEAMRENKEEDEGKENGGNDDGN